MRFVDKKQKLDYLLEIIKNESTGSACKLAKCICVSLPTFNRYLADLRALGYEIEYSRTRQTYLLIESHDYSKNDRILSVNDRHTG